LSVVVATHNRARLLGEALQALAQQDCEFDDFEVVVAADSCTDNTADLVNSFGRSSPYHLRLVSHEARNPSATRNLGAVHANGETIIFLDDDLIARTGLVRAHAERRGPDRVVIGYVKPKLPAQPCLVQLNAARWWEDRFREMRCPGYRFSYRDCFSGNVSVPAALFHRIGGFNHSFTRQEDYELGVRLICAGARFCYAQEAAGDHYEITDLAIRARRIWIEGKATVELCRCHPELRSSLFWNATEPSLRAQRFIRRLALVCGRRGDLLESLIVRQAALFEALRLRSRYQLVMQLLYEFNFWRGVSVALGGRRALAAWVQDAEAESGTAADAPVLDFAAPPPSPHLENLLAEGSRRGLRVVLKEAELLAIPPEFGSEPLRWEHVERAVTELAKRRFLPALALDLICSPGGVQLQA
jgi:glycosyltransferase involved in cell wall biosynthesis